MKISNVEFSLPSFTARKNKPIGFSYTTNTDLFELSDKNKSTLISDINNGLNVSENKQILTLKYIPLVQKHANSLSEKYPDIDVDDLIQHGLCSLNEVIQNKKENEKLTQNHILSRIRTSMETFAKSEQGRLEKTEPLSKIDTEYTSTDVFDTMQRNIIPTYIRQIVECINGKQREALAERFGLSGGKEQSFDEVGQKLEISKDNAKQSSANALRSVQKMKETLKMKPLLDSIESGYDEVKNLTLPLKF